MLYRTVVLTDEGDGFKFPFFDLAWNEGWDVLYKLRQVEIGGINGPEMKKWLLGVDNYANPHRLDITSIPDPNTLSTRLAEIQEMLSSC